ncbi:DUF5076 domain-containing protein [Mesorhizobium muleiense]|uniref:DUF5076 domain-containing protein n=1 Tax=Mesorhizobium muleiense TaxID=1004279 RepID=UPI0039AEA633
MDWFGRGRHDARPLWTNAHNWGMVLADVDIHIARMRLEQDGIPEIETLQALEEGYRGRMSEQFNIQHRSLTGRN